MNLGVLIRFASAVSIALLPATVTCSVAATPPMGFNTWNLYACGVNASVLMRSADALISSGLAQAGYRYVNSDDCWMLATRNARGQQVADPTKFPDGFANVTAYIHSKGLLSGLYTAKGNWTCQHKAASCLHERIDAAQWASWGIDYVKDDSCSQCADFSDDEDYRRMWEAIEASGRSMVLTVEANPVDVVISKGGYGNAKRVGHDIKPFFANMLSLADIGSGLWPFAHNATGYERYGGWWNDLDMIEIGNGPDFLCAASPAAAARCRVHFSLWTIMKAVLLLGNDITSMDDPTRTTLGNAKAISVNQDPLGVQGRRVRVMWPSSHNNLTAAGPNHNVAVVRESNDPQRWHFELHNASALVGVLQMRQDGQKWCLGRFPHPDDFLVGVSPCPDAPHGSAAWDQLLVQLVKSTGSDDVFSIHMVKDGGNQLGINNQSGASGPLPHSRYVSGGANTFRLNLDSLCRGLSPIQANSDSLINDDLVGTITIGGTFFLDVAALGMVETWASPLVGGAIAVLVVNRSPFQERMVVSAGDIGAQFGNSYTVDDVWPGQNTIGPTFTNDAVATVPPFDAVYYILTPTQ